MTESTRCPDCGRERPAGTSPIGLCPFCLLTLGLDAPPAAGSPWLDSARWSCRVLNVLDVEDMMTSYLAEQMTPSRRLVVLTEVAVELHGDDEQSRFEAALQSVVDFNHDLVARVFGGVKSEAGAMYLVSEYVSGAPLVRHCAKVNAEARQRAALCLSVVEAIRAAHDARLVHGSLTPAHVVITTRGGMPTPMVTGLGVALATRKPPDLSDDVAALVELARLLGLEVPAPTYRTTRELADWLRGQI